MTEEGLRNAPQKRRQLIGTGMRLSRRRSPSPRDALASPASEPKLYRRIPKVDGELENGPASGSERANTWGIVPSL